MKRTRTAQAGLTMLEVVIATVILTVIAGMSAYLVWNSSRSVSSAETALQLENTAREVLNLMVQELRQAKKSAILKVVTKPVSAIKTVNTNPPVAGASVTPTDDEEFDGIRFDLLDPRDKFDLDNFKNATERFYTIQYWWQVDEDEQALPKDGGTGPNGRDPNLKDDNRNGVVDEGVLMKMETTYLADRVTIDQQKISIVLRNVKKFTLKIPAATSAADVAAGKPNYKSDRIEVKVDLEIMDPKHNRQDVADASGKEAFLIMKSVSAIVDFRN